MLWQERIESIKAGLVGAIACALGAIAVSLLTFFCLPPTAVGFSLASGPDGLGLNGLGDFSGQSALIWQGADWAIAALTGFLFAVTYRYVIRQDLSSHLRSGAVLAFGLVRGLAQVDVAWLLGGEPLLLLVLLGESVVLVAIARWALDLGLNQGWLKPFQGFD